MTDQKLANDGAEINDSISFAALPEHIFVVKITGRGSFHNSMELRRLADTLLERADTGLTPRYILDLQDCVTMDSTFMGVLASIGLRQLKLTGEMLTVVNANEQNVRLLSTLGLSQFIVVRELNQNLPEDNDFQCLAKENVSRRERIIHMIEAHQELCDADTANALRFESVLKYLEDSLREES